MSDVAGHDHGGCAPGGSEKLNAEGEIAVARLAMDSGDLSHAAAHLGFALAEAPQLPEAQEALAEFAARAGGPEAALEFFAAERPYIGAAACSAHLLAAAGRWEAALGLIATVLRHEPDRPWGDVAWLHRADLAELVDPQAVANAVAQVLGGGLPESLSEGQQQALRPFLTLVRASLERHPRASALLTMGSGLARRLGEPETAINWARQALLADPHGHTPAVMLGYALRAAGRADEALAVWEEELRRDPGDVPLHVDIAELYADTGRPEQGLPWLERALATEPGHPQAAPALHGVRFAADGDLAHLVALADHLRAHPDHRYAAALLARHSAGRPWLSGVTGAREATIDVLHTLLAEGAASDAPLQLAASQLEAPSAVLTVLQAFPRARMDFGSVPEPDPRLPLRGGAEPVWHYEGRVARPVAAAPSAAAAEAVRGTAEVRWPSLPAAYDHAVRLAGVPPEELLGALVHPPLPRDDRQGRHLAAHLPELWVRAVQAFACLGLAHHATDEPWAGSRRRRLLLDLLDGPEDWVTEAAGLALLAVAWCEPDTRRDVGERLVVRFLDAAQAWRTRPVEVLPSLCRFVLACPWLETTWLETAQLVLGKIEEEDAQPPDETEMRAQAERLLARARAGRPEPGPAGTGAPGPGAPVPGEAAADAPDPGSTARRWNPLRRRR